LCSGLKSVPRLSFPLRLNVTLKAKLMFLNLGVIVFAWSLVDGRLKTIRFLVFSYQVV
jgi:hypothetical protein